MLAAFTLFFAALSCWTGDAGPRLQRAGKHDPHPAAQTDGRVGGWLNNYFTNYTKYVKDQVFGRDQWISLQSLAETTLFQKTQSGGIRAGAGAPDVCPALPRSAHEERVWNKNLAAVQSLGERYPGKVSFMLVPSASVLYPEDLPLAAPQMDEEGRIDEAKAALPAVQFLRVTDALRAHKDEYLYYRTDTTGRRWGLLRLRAVCEAQGLTPFDRSAHPVETAENFYGTHYSKARTWNAEPDTITWYDLQNRLTIWNVTAPGQPTEAHRPACTIRASWTFTTSMPCSSTATTA